MQAYLSHIVPVQEKKIKLADGFLSAIAGKGSISISPSLTLHEVLHVPNLSYNLLSVNKLLHDLNCQAQFFSSHCEFLDLILRRMIGSARQREELYFLEDGSVSRRRASNSCFNSISASNNSDVML